MQLIRHARTLAYAASIGTIMVTGGISVIVAAPLALIISVAIDVLTKPFREESAVSDARSILREVKEINTFIK